MPNLTNPAQVTSYVSQEAAQGASVAYAKGGNAASSTPVPPPTTVQFSTSVVTEGGTVVTSTIMKSAGWIAAPAWPITLLWIGVAALGGAVLL